MRRFLRLAASGNPSILMALWAPVLYITPAGEELRALADAFVGRHVIPRYRGYMQAQTLRLLGLRGGVMVAVKAEDGRS
ncbi:MAG TPA: nucleotidyltransferase domain-containing protein [Acidimicrobiales bacterium]|nr:nucleotidyltransferase domain-containing protein [Acidimicrobiales bacterium]